MTDKAPPKAVKKPTYSQMVTAAIVALKDRKGSSKQAIEKYVVANYALGPKSAWPLKMALKRGVESGALVQVKGKGASGSFKLGKIAKKPVKKPVAKKVVKKPAVKKAAKKVPAKKVAAAKKAPKPSGKAKAAVAKKPAKKIAKKPAKKAPAKKAPAKKAPKPAAKKAKK